MRGGKARQLVIRIVPRLDANQTAKRGIFDIGFAVSGIERATRQEGFSFVRVVLQNGRAEVDLSTALPDPLPHFERRQMRKLLLLIQHQGSRFADYLRSLADWFTRPDFTKCLIGGREHSFHLLIGVLLEGAQNLFVERIYTLICHSDESFFFVGFYARGNAVLRELEPT